MVSPRISAGALACALLALGACGDVPNDVSPGLQQETNLGPVGQRPTIGQISATPFEAGEPAAAGPSGSIESIAAGAIAEAEQSGSTGGGGVFDNIQPQNAADALPPPIIPRVAAFAIRTTHAPGQRQWRRNPFRRNNGADCASYESRDLAQDAFLREGGPERDPMGLDPDGDGFVCGFDPAGYRSDAAAANAPEPIPQFGDPLEAPVEPAN
ncbi:hypothetical protein [Gymnodinialimonas hymeniacidonis]|uniref:hypothetical protein n=1 Tax=Gymnodinialimonas hymeniacidonis TaxID=3126508 RepID=UPI0034C64A52